MNANPLHADYYADTAAQQTVAIVEQERLARDTVRLRFHCPRIAGRILPGQFLMLRIHGLNDPLIGRPLALFDLTEDETGERTLIDVVYLVKGKLTTRLAELGPGQQLEVWGPLGNGFPLRPVNHLVMVAGGIGQTPFLALADEYLGRQSFGDPPRQQARAERVTLCYGARTAEFLAGVERFRAAGVDVRVATDDGSAGHHGLVTEVLSEVLDASSECHVVCCGPEPMMAAVAELTSSRQASCDVSLETPMACGIGICFTCVARVKQADGGWDYKRTCVEGPVFAAESIVW